MTNKLRLVILSALTFIMTMAPIQAGAVAPTLTAAPGANIIQMPAPPEAFCYSTILWDRQTTTIIINAGVYLCSPDGRYKALFQGDGNWVVYDQVRGVPIWNSKTAGNPGSKLVIQSDRNIVIYRTNGTPAWSTGTFVTQSYGYINRTLTMQNDGNLVFYEKAIALVPLWSSKTGKL